MLPSISDESFRLASKWEIALGCREFLQIGAFATEKSGTLHSAWLRKCAIALWFTSPNPPMKNDWHNFDLNDDATHPHNGAKVEIQSSNGKTFEVFLGKPISGRVDQVNSLLPEIPERADWQRWRYKNAD